MVYTYFCIYVHIFLHIFTYVLLCLLYIIIIIIFNSFLNFQIDAVYFLELLTRYDLRE